MEDRALAGLQVAVVPGRQRQQLLDLHARRRHTGVGGAHQLDDVRVALVRHDRTAGGVLRRQRDEAELRAGEQRQVPGDAAQVQRGTAQGLQRGQFELAARELRVDGADLHAREAQHGGGVFAVQLEVDAIAGRGAQRIGVHQLQRVARAHGVVDEGFRPAGPPHAGGRHHGPLDIGVARNRQVALGLRTIQRHLGDLPRQHRHAGELFLQPQARGHQDLVVAAAAGMDLAAGVAQAFGQPRLDGGVAIFETLVQHELATLEILGEDRQFALQPGQLVAGEDADALQALGMRGAGLDVVQEERAVQYHVVAREETLDLRVHRHAGLLPQQIRHRNLHRTVGAPSGAMLFVRPMIAPKGAPTRARLRALPSRTPG